MNFSTTTPPLSVVHRVALLRRVTALIAVMLVFLGPKSAQAVGAQDVAVPDPGGKPLSVRIWSPTDSSGVAMGIALPLVIISHGSGGSLADYADTAAALARAGFVVASPQHTGDNYKDHSYVAQGRDLADRPRQISRVIDYMLSDWPEHGRIDSSRIGMFGHSGGGFTALVVAGASPDTSRGVVYCHEHPQAWGCLYVQKYGLKLDAIRPAKNWAHDPRVKAAVIAAPCCGYMLEGTDLSAVHIPIQLWQAEKDVIVDDSPAVIARLLPNTLDLRTVPNAGHFAFMTPCDWKMNVVIAVLRWTGTPDICGDPAGFDRPDFHRQFNADIVAFFRKNLAPTGP